MQLFRFQWILIDYKFCLTQRNFLTWTLNFLHNLPTQLSLIVAFGIPKRHWDRPDLMSFQNPGQRNPTSDANSSCTTTHRVVKKSPLRQTISMAWGRRLQSQEDTIFIDATGTLPTSSNKVPWKTHLRRWLEVSIAGGHRHIRQICGRMTHNIRTWWRKCWRKCNLHGCIYIYIHTDIHRHSVFYLRCIQYNYIYVLHIYIYIFYTHMYMHMIYVVRMAIMQECLDSFGTMYLSKLLCCDMLIFICCYFLYFLCLFIKLKSPHP